MLNLVCVSNKYEIYRFIRVLIFSGSESTYICEKPSNTWLVRLIGPILDTSSFIGVIKHYDHLHDLTIFPLFSIKQK